MKIIFAGTPDFAVPCLQALLNSTHEIVAVYTKPDQPAGRGQIIMQSPIKQLALQYQLPIQQPKTLRDPSEQQRLIEWHADIMVVIAYGLILPKAVLETPRFGCINVHASLLPRWRGASPIQQAILAGDTESGVTIMQMDEGLDTGPMLNKVACPIYPTDNSQQLHDRLANLGAPALLSTLAQIENGKQQAEIQDDTLACYAKKIDKNDAEINWQEDAVVIDRKIRGFNPWPIAFTYLNSQPIRIWQAQPLPSSTPALPGTIINTEKQGIDVATGKNILRIQSLQLPGGRQLSVSDILNSRAEWFRVGTVLGNR